MPERIQLRRTKGWRLPAWAINVARPTRWGNPYIVGSPVQISGVDADGLLFDMPGVLSRQDVVDLYRVLIKSRIEIDPDDHPADLAYSMEWRSAIEALRGHDLACWCKPGAPCHADVLLELANQPQEGPLTDTEQAT